MEHDIYHKYCKALERVVPGLKKEIKDSPEGKLQITAKDLAKKLGHEFEDIKPTSIYWGTKPCLFENDIATSGYSPTRHNKEYIILMRTRTPGDKLPISMRRT